MDGEAHGTIVNLADRRAAASRTRQLELLGTLGPDGIIAELARLSDARHAAGSSPARPAVEDAPLLPHLVMPAHHEVRAANVVERRLHGALAAAAERGPADFPDLLLTPGVGARTVLSLALVAEVLHGTPCRFTDPARFSIAHGGKDRNPFPVPTKVYDETIRVMKRAVRQARLGAGEELAAIRRLDGEARRLEGAGGPTVDAVIAEERRRSHEYGGRSTFGWEAPPRPSAAPRRPPRRAAADAPTLF